MLVPRERANAARLLAALRELPYRAFPRRLSRRIQGTRVPYLGLEDLIASKATGRPQDIGDVEMLRALAAPTTRGRSRRRSRR